MEKIVRKHGYRVYAIACMVAIIVVAILSGFFTPSEAAPSDKPSDKPSESASIMPGQPVDLTYAAEKALPSVVYIKAVHNSKVQTIEVQGSPFDFLDPFGGFFGRGGNSGSQKRQVQTPKTSGVGSGVIISEDGYIVTNYHVVNGADELTVSLDDNSEYSAKIVGSDEATDLALIKISADNEHNGGKSSFPAIQIGSSDDLKVGQWVLAVGNPYGFTGSVTAGIVSAKARSLGANGVESFIQTDAAINKGNSGGALVNAQGELVGINAMLYSQTGAYSGLGFAIPTAIMNKVVEDLKKYGTVQRAYLGIKGGNVKDYVDDQKNNGNNVDLGTMEGVYVAEVIDGSGAAEAGLKAGDVITKVDGQKITKMPELQELMARKKPGDKANITYIRDKKEKSSSITLKNEEGNTGLAEGSFIQELGASFREISGDSGKSAGVDFGLEVTGVGPGKMADANVSKGFIIQKVNGSPIKTISQLNSAIKEASRGKEPVLYIQGVLPSGKRAYLAIPLEE